MTQEQYEKKIQDLLDSIEPNKETQKDIQAVVKMLFVCLLDLSNGSEKFVFDVTKVFYELVFSCPKVDGKEDK